MTIFSSEKWSSSFYELAISYNPNVWSLIPQLYDGEDGVLFGVMDFNDGASFGFDLTFPESDEYYEYEFGEAEYYSRLFNVDNSVKEIDRFALSISSVEFQCVGYVFYNPKYGYQHLIRGMHIGDPEVIGISMAWVLRSQSEAEIKIPPKFHHFLNNFALGAPEIA